MESNLMFAPLIRVSTETQERRGESLNTQRKQLESAIHSLGGKPYHWYAGAPKKTTISINSTGFVCVICYTLVWIMPKT
jgi:hypothetical protein